jgi:hypothetical protein
MHRILVREMTALLIPAMLTTLASQNPPSNGAIAMKPLIFIDGFWWLRPKTGNEQLLFANISEQFRGALSTQLFSS